MPLFSILRGRTVKCTKIGNKADMGLIWDFLKAHILQVVLS